MTRIRSSRRLDRPRIRDTRRVERRGNLFGKIVIDRPVLIVEDSRSLAKTIATLLTERWGCDVHIAESLNEARKLLEKHGWDYISAVCNVSLPDAPAGEILDVLKELAIPTIAIADVLDDTLREMIVKKGVADYVLKEGGVNYEYIVQLIGRIYKNLSIKALILSDSLSARTILEHMLNTQCLRTLVAADGKTALKLLNQHPDIQLVIVDYPKPEPMIVDYPVLELPGMDGFAFTQQARKLLGKDRLAIIGISASPDEGTAARFLKYGANDFISKPFSYEELSCRIAQNLEMLEQIETIREVANRDFLTGLHNRRFFFERGHELYHDASQDAVPLAIAMIDIDHFKTLNDIHGHDVGDSVLKHFSGLLSQSFGKELLARLGGEEFAVLMCGEGVADARVRCEAFVRMVASTPAMHEGKAIPFTVSMGLNSRLGTNLNEMLKVADDRLYQAKDAGRNRVESEEDSQDSRQPA